MAAKFALICFASFVVFQVLLWQTDASIIRREVTSGATPNKNQIDEAFDSLKQGILEFIGKVEGSEVYQNVSKVLDSFGQKVKQQGEQVLLNIQSGTIPQQTPSH